MEDLKFKSKIKKLVDIKSKLDFVINDISREKLSQNDHYLGEVIFEVNRVLNDLEEFKAFHVHDIIQRVLEVFHNVKNNEIKLSKNLFEVIFHLLQVGFQQVILLQDVIENKMIAHNSIQILDQELGRNNKFFDVLRRPVELPSLTFNNLDKLDRLPKNELIKAAPKNKNLSVDTEHFDKMMLSYTEMVRSKNLLILNHDDKIANLYKNINEFSQIYEQLNLIPINKTLDNVVVEIENYIKLKELDIALKSFWGKSRFPYFKMELFEKFVHNLLELLVDYVETENSGTNILEIKTNANSCNLTLSLRSRFFEFSFEEKANQGNDHRINYFFELLEKLDASFDIRKIDNLISSFLVSIPLRSEVVSAYLISLDDRNYFVLEDEIQSFHMIDSKLVSFKDNQYFYKCDQEVFSILNYKESFKKLSDQYIILFKDTAGLRALIVDEIQNKEQVVLDEGAVYYRDSKILIISTSTMAKNGLMVLESKESA